MSRNYTGDTPGGIDVVLYDLSRQYINILCGLQTILETRGRLKVWILCRNDWTDRAVLLEWASLYTKNTLCQKSKSVWFPK